MPLARRLLPLAALLLGTVVAAQALDVAACADDSTSWHGAASNASGLDADGLCHLVYVSEAAPPDLAAARLAWEPVPTAHDAALRHRAHRRVERPPIG